MRGARRTAWAEQRPPVSPFDCALAAGAGLTVAGSSLDVGPVTVALLVVAASTLAWRRIHPGPAAVVALLCVLAAWVGLVGGAPTGTATGWTLGLGGGVLLTSTYSVTAWGVRVLVPLALLGGVGSAVVVGVLLEGAAVTSTLVGGVVVAVLAWTAGQWRRTQLHLLASVLERARRAEAAGEQADRLATARERTRIAREMHDVIAHSLAVMTAQADGARFVMDGARGGASGKVQAALRAIGETGRAASQDMAGLLGALSDPEAPVDDARRPQPRLCDLPDLVDDVTSAGLAVSLRAEGDPVELSPGVEVTVYRAVQEALTNVLKHAGTRAVVDVVLAWTAGRLTVRVLDDGPGYSQRSSEVTSGRGLAGMRERVALLDGGVRAGPGEQGGFQVEITVPLAPRVAS